MIDVAVKIGTRNAKVSNQIVAINIFTILLVKIVRIGNKMARLRSMLTQTSVNIEQAIEPAWAEWKNLQRKLPNQPPNQVSPTNSHLTTYGISNVIHKSAIAMLAMRMFVVLRMWLQEQTMYTMTVLPIKAVIKIREAKIVTPIVTSRGMTKLFGTVGGWVVLLVALVMLLPKKIITVVTMN